MRILGMDPGLRIPGLGYGITCLRKLVCTETRRTRFWPGCK